MENLFHELANFFLGMGYIGVFIMMTMESSFIPFPSELALLPAGYLVGQGKLDPILVFLAGTLGSMAGATINYLLGVFLGRELIIKHGRILFLNEEKFQKIEKIFVERGEAIVFFGRFIPVVRQYISFPPGVVKMNFTKFLLFTGLASGIYVLILEVIGYYYENHKKLINELVMRFKVVIIIFIIVYIIYLIVKKVRSKK